MKSFKHAPEERKKIGQVVRMYRLTMFFEREDGERYEQDSTLEHPFVIGPGETIDVTSHIKNHFVDEEGNKLD